MKTIIAFVCALATAVCGQDREELGKRIVNGAPVAKNSYPFLASLQLYSLDNHEWQHICGAVLIQSDKLLTAAHCVYRNTNGTWRVVLGVTNIDPAEVKKNAIIGIVKKIVLYPAYRPGNNNLAGYNDIAIVYLIQRVVTTDRVKPPPRLVTQGMTFIGSQCSVAGWGRTRTGATGVDTNSHLMEANVTKLSNHICQFFYPDRTIPQSVFCLFELDEKLASRPDSCGKDMGGPVMCGEHKEVLAGITSVSKSCEGTLPSIYTRLSEYMEWIRDN